MSSAAATTLGLAIYAVALVPLVWIAVKNDTRAVSPICTALILALAAYQTGIFNRSSLISSDVHWRSAGLTDDRCKKILEAVKEAGLSIDRSRLDKPKLVGAGVDQMPPEIATILIDCFENEETSPMAAERLKRDA